MCTRTPNFLFLLFGVLIAISFNFVIGDFITFYSLFLFGIVIDFWTSFVYFCLCVRVAGACFGAWCPTSICFSSWIGSLWPTLLIGGSIHKIITSWYQRTYCLTSHVWGNSWYRLTIGDCTCGWVIVIVFIKKARCWKKNILANKYRMPKQVLKKIKMRQKIMFQKESWIQNLDFWAKNPLFLRIFKCKNSKKLPEKIRIFKCKNRKNYLYNLNFLAKNRDFVWNQKKQKLKIVEFWQFLAGKFKI